ncbi:MAG: PAS domain S-box protein [Deltaproteobacteria bacterium]|nr:PAS domain S-box protein [Deltaproteobacteria bacterium]
MEEGNEFTVPLDLHSIGTVMPEGNGIAAADGAVRMEKAMPPCSTKPVAVIGIGASSGGVDALQRFFAAMPSDSGMSFVVAMRLTPDNASLLPDVLGRCTTMKVQAAEKGMPLCPDTIYVIHSGGGSIISGDRFRSAEPLRPHEARHPIDRFFRALATEREEGAFAVILSGTGTDGIEGVRAVKGAGGVVFVQDPDSAAYADLPRGAIESGAADLVLPVQLIPGKLMEVFGRTSQRPSRKKMPAELDDQLRAIFRMVKSGTGHDFSSYKTNTVMRRLERRMSLKGVGVLGEYVALLKESPQEAKDLCREFLIGVTSFFRDPEAFERLREVVIPGLFANRDPEDPVRIWHACCATGEEAYSTAILIREYLDEHHLHCKVQIFATDIDESAIVRARAGSYHEGIEADVSEERLRKFFTVTDGRYQVIKPLREMIIFAHHNLIRDPPFSRLDLLVCRNFLIYLNPEMQMRLIPLFHQVLKPGGLLFFGTSETIERHSDLFVPVDKKWKIFKRREGARRVDTHFPLSPFARTPPRFVRTVHPAEDDDRNPGKVVEKLLMERYSPPCVVVNEKYEVVHVSTRTSLFLEMPLGEPSRDILRMTCEELRPTLRAAIHKAFAEQKQVVFRGVRFGINGEMVTVNILAEPIASQTSGGSLAMVVFEPTSPPVTVSEAPPVAGEEHCGDETSRDALIRQLEEQLRVSHEQLQATIEQLETSNEGLISANEELLSTNEEFQSTNEELQSTNEELETSKEELQALNEELVTVNAELHDKVEELNRTGSDLENLFNSSEIATVFLDRSLNIKRFTPAITGVFDLIPSDIGRPFRHMAGKIEWPEFSSDADMVLRQHVPIEREVTTREEGRCFIMRVLPYLTHDGGVDGIVVTFVDFTERKQAEEALRRSEERLRRLTDHLPCYVCYVDSGERYRFVNETYRSWFGLDPASILGLKVEELVGPENYRVIKPRIDEALAGRSISFDYLMKLPDDTRRYVNITYVPDRGVDGAVRGIYVTAIDLSERRKNEQALRESEERFRMLFEGHRAVMLLVEPLSGAIVDGNGAAVDFYGYSREELRSLKISDINRMTPEEVAAIRQSIVEGRQSRFIAPHRLADGEIRQVEVYSSPIITGGKSLLFSIIHDITERRMAEEALCESETRYRLLFENMMHGFSFCRMLFDDQGLPEDFVYLDVNKAFESLTGLKNVLGKKVTDVIPGVREANPELFEIYGRVALTGQPERFEIEFKPLESWFSVSVYSTEKECFVAVFDNITERKRAEDALRESEERWQFAIEGSNDGVWDRNIRTGEVFFSRQWKEMLGFAEDEIGSSFDEWSNRIHHDDLPRVRDELEKHLRGETAQYAVEFRMQCKDGSYKWILARGRVISRTEDGEPIRFVGTQSDMTERKNLEAQLYQAQKMEAVGQLAGGVAHDFNNILTAILGYSHLIIMQTGEDDRLRYYVDQIRVSAERAAELTKALLTFSRKQVIVSRVVNLNETVLYVRNMLRRLISENIDLHFDVFQEDLYVMADSGKIEQVLMNLATNAKDAIPRDGTIIIGTSRVSLNGGFVQEHDYIIPGEYARISVSDTGCGMDEETKRKIFEPFFTTKEVGKGTGLGLSIVYGIVKQHNGFIEVHSEAGTGTVFNIFLPLVEPDGESQAEGEEPPPPQGTETILLAEDDSSVREFHKTLFESAGYTVITACHGIEAFEKFTKHEKEIDLLVFDVIMPRMNGREAYGHIRKKRPEIKVLFLSGYAGDVLNEAGVAREMEPFLHKPVNPNKLLTKVHELLRGEP